MASVFISYSHFDKSVADEILDILSDLGVDVFRDVKDIDWGDSITTKVRDALNTCVAVLVIVSPASLKSHWVPYEIGYAAALLKIILPFLTHPALDVPDYIRGLSYVKTTEQVRDYFANKFTADTKNVPTLYKSAADIRAGTTGPDPDEFARAWRRQVAEEIRASREMVDRERAKAVTDEMVGNLLRDKLGR